MKTKEQAIRFIEKHFEDYAQYEYWLVMFMEFFKIKEEDLK